MLDAITLPFPPAEAADWRQTLSWGDIVAYRFPCAPSERDQGYRPKSRPCVVLDVVSFAGDRFVTLAYGTTSDGDANRGREVRVADPEALKAIGLQQPTRFVGSRRVTVSVTHAGFSRGDRGTPVLGRLVGAERVRLNEVRARLFAEADMAAERHAERRRRSRRKAGPREIARPTVVARYPRRRNALPGKPAVAAVR